MTNQRQPSCPPATTLSAWLDDELSDTESKMIKVHLEQCASCCEQVAGWVQVVRELRPPTASAPEHHSRARITNQHDSPFDELRAGSARITMSESSKTCLDEEMLVAYSEAELNEADAARAEQHLQACTHCVAEVQRLIHLRVAMGEKAVGLVAPAHPAAAAAAADFAPQHSGRRLRNRTVGATRWVASLGELARSIGETLARPWPALGAIAATVALVLVVGRLLPLGNHVGDVQLRGVQMEQRRVEVIADNTVARARPGDDQVIVATLGRGTVANGLEEAGEWTRIELADGRRVWVHSTNLLRAKEPPP